ncbi:MAG: ATP-binding protein [Mariniphaga sp.]|jgi:serine/threonine-protein kinase RsbW|nr:ATP-binding protein [Mariniphaga sp.]
MRSSPKILAIKSDKKELEKLENFLFQIFEKEELPKACFNKVYLCISEAVINSIEHGNKNDREKQVDIQIDCMNGNICVEIHDEGEGFDFKHIEDPTLNNNIRKETGRGIHIMKSLCSNLEFRNDGKSVEIKIDVT